MSTQTLNECLVHTPLCVYPFASNVLILDESLNKEAQKHKVQIFNQMQDKEKFFDVCIATNLSREQILPIYRSLKDDGILMILSSDINSKEYKAQLSSLDVFRFVVPAYFGAAHLDKSAIFASKKYHPTAHFNLQIADFIEDLSVYNSSMHLSFFAMPSNILQDLKPFIKL